MFQLAIAWELMTLDTRVRNLKASHTFILKECDPRIVTPKRGVRAYATGDNMMAILHSPSCLLLLLLRLLRALLLRTAIGMIAAHACYRIFMHALLPLRLVAPSCLTIHRFSRQH